MIKTSDFLFEMGLSLKDAEVYRDHLFKIAGSKESYNLLYRDAVLGDSMEVVTKVYGNQFIDIFRCVGCRYVIFEKDDEGFYKINVKSFVVEPDMFTYHD